jgi:hypothetical protein
VISESLALIALLSFQHQDSTKSVAPEPRMPVLSSPDPALDDTASYQGYQTRFYKDSRDNAVQIYLEPRGGRVVTLWADAADESAGFTARDGAGRPAGLQWGAAAAQVSERDRQRSIEYQLIAGESRVDLGGFVIGSMRVERDYQYAKRHLQPLTPSFVQVAEESLVVAAMARLPAAELNRHLVALSATTIDGLRSRLTPSLTEACSDSLCAVRIERPSLDARNRLSLEIRVDPRRTKIQVTAGTVSIRTRPGTNVKFTVRVSTDAAPLSPLRREEIFNQEFLQFLAAAQRARDSAGVNRYGRLERQVRGVELLSSKEKLMAGLPNFATYFGRDMMMTALMMRPIWSPGMSEHVIASVLRKLGPRGDVSHEEALGGQAIRENAVVYDSLVGAYLRTARRGGRTQSEGLLKAAVDVLRSLQKTRENYHMIDDEFQLPVLVARYLGDSAVPATQKRAFLLDSTDKRGPRLALLLRELSLVSSWTRPYVESPHPLNLVSFPKRDATHWRSASWRDSDAGYAGGRFAMDINVIWVPNALQSIETILKSLSTLGFTEPVLDSMVRASGGMVLAQYVRDPSTLQQAIDTWRGARRHFEVALSSSAIQQRTASKLAWLPPEEREHWRKVMAEQNAAGDSLNFLALSLDSRGRPIPVVNTDPATELFLTERLDTTLLRDIAPVLRPYPVGLLVDGLGPLVINDAYAGREVWERFKGDLYHGPRVVWGREVNLMLLGLIQQMSKGLTLSKEIDVPPTSSAVARFWNAFRHIRDAVNASGLQHNELWSYDVKAGRLVPIRYGTSSDVQLWNTTNLVVQYLGSWLPDLSRYNDH